MGSFKAACPRCHHRVAVADRRKPEFRGTCRRCGHRFAVRAIRPDQLDELAQPTINRVAEASRRRRRNQRVMMAVAAGAMVILFVSIILLLRRDRAGLPSSTPTSETVTADPAAAPPDELSASDVGREEGLDRTTGEPIQLFMVPSGARVIVHFRPADFWRGDPQMAELRACLTEDILAALEGHVRRLTSFEPAAIEELLLAWILGARGSEPQLACVVRCAEVQRLSELIDQFGGQPFDEFTDSQVYINDEQAVLIRDTRTLAIVPRQLAHELTEWTDAPNQNTSDGILALLEKTDRERLLTVVFEPADLQRHLDRLFVEPARDIVRLVTSWFADGAETVAWSIDLDEEFSSEILLRPRTTESSRSAADRAAERMQAIPENMVRAVRAMNPKRAGFRRVMGRFPAMLEVFRLATATVTGDRLVRLNTVLPPKAGPNLVLATLLTWNESTRHATGQAGESIVSGREDAGAPLTLVERLQLPVDAEFRRTPLQEAIAYIAAEIDIEIEIDGQALKDAGYTKNMPQTFDLGRVRAAEALWEIMRKYQQPGKEMVLVLDEQRQRATILTRKFAEQRGQVPYDFDP